MQSAVEFVRARLQSPLKRARWLPPASLESRRGGFGSLPARRSLTTKLCDSGSTKLCRVEVRLIVSEPDDDFGCSLPFGQGLQS